jgi:hypothetical protein
MALENFFACIFGVDQYLWGGAQAKEHATPPHIPMEDYGLT